MKEKISDPIHLRPSFTISLNEKAEVIIQKFKKALTENNKKFLCRFSEGHIIIDVPKREDHFWSPELNLEVISVDETNSLVKGSFGPKPQVWKIFMFFHFVI